MDTDLEVKIPRYESGSMRQIPTGWYVDMGRGHYDPPTPLAGI